MDVTIGGGAKAALGAADVATSSDIVRSCFCFQGLYPANSCFVHPNFSSNASSESSC